MPDILHLDITLRTALIALFFASAGIIFIYRHIFRSASVELGDNGKVHERNLNRTLGEWKPDTTFRYPEIPAHSATSLADIDVISYRPFKWGPDYHVTMGVRNMPFETWIELDNQFSNYHNIKAHRIRTRGKDAIQVLDDRLGAVKIKSGRAGAIELVHEISEYLHRRYPSTFSVTRSSPDSPIRSISIVPLGKCYDLPDPLVVGENTIQEVTQEDAERAMVISALLIQDDLALMVEGSDGKYYFQAGAICVPGFWRMKDKLGLPLDEIHMSGNVPQYREKLHTSLERFFRRLPVDKPVIRNNYFIQVVQPENSLRRNTSSTSTTMVGDPELEADDLIDTEELGWSYTTNGPEDFYQHGRHGHPSTKPDIAAQTLRLRTERQTLRRLPLSGAVVFGIRTYLFPMVDIAEERVSGTPGRLASAIKSWPPDVQQYKGKALYGDWLVNYLEQEQGKMDTWESRTEYPF